MELTLKPLPLTTTLILLVVSSCSYAGKTEFERAIEKGFALEREKKFQESAEMMLEARKIAEKAERDKDAIYAEFLRGKMLEKAGLTEEAIKIYMSIESYSNDYSTKGRAIYEAGNLYYINGNIGKAERLFLKFVKLYPDHGLCSVALKKLMLIEEEKYGTKSVKTLLLSLLPEALTTSFGDDILWELAKLEEKEGNMQSAKNYLLKLDKLYPYPSGGSAFEYLFMLSEIEYKAGRFEVAIQWLKKITFTAEKSYLIGDYNDDAKATALIKIGRIYLEKLNQPRRAYKFFMKVVKLGWPARADDGLWWASQSLLAENQNEKACKLISRLIDKYPYSNYRRKSLELFRSGICEK